MQVLRPNRTDAAFERLYQRHVKDVYRYALAVLGEQADAEDVTQTTFLNAYRAFQRGERPAKAQNWLITIAHNVCRQRFRQAQRRPNEVELTDAIGDPMPEHDGPSVEELQRAFSQLPPNQRAALVMRELEGRSYAEIAEIMQISQSALETLLFRARRTLREQLEESITCEEAAFAISQQLDGRLPNEGRRALRAHLRACPQCARSAQRERAVRGVLKTMLAVPLPQSLASFFGGGAAATSAAAGAGAAGVGVGVGLKAVALLTAGTVAAGAAYVGVEKRPLLRHRAPAAPVATIARTDGESVRAGAVTQIPATTVRHHLPPQARAVRNRFKAPTQQGKAHTQSAKAPTQQGKAQTQGKAHTQPAKAHTPPAKAHTQPAKAHTQPAKAHTQPAKAHTQPAKAHTQQGNAAAQQRNAAAQQAKAQARQGKAPIKQERVLPKPPERAARVPAAPGRQKPAVVHDRKQAQLVPPAESVSPPGRAGRTRP